MNISVQEVFIPGQILSQNDNELNLDVENEKWFLRWKQHYSTSKNTDTCRITYRWESLGVYNILIIMCIIYYKLDWIAIENRCLRIWIHYSRTLFIWSTI